jgi:putative hydrolase of the HAD superfamily
MKRTVLVFDLDDTLYAEREFVLSGFAAVDRWLQEKRGIVGFAPEATRVFAAGKRGRIFDEVLGNLGIGDTAELVPKLVEIYRAHKPQLTLFAEARWAIERFREHFKLGLITDGYAETQRNKVAALGIGKLFDCIVFTDDLGRENWKPSPMAFRLMMNRLGVEGHECVYVGDNPVKDFLAPNELGWLTVLISRDGGEYGKAGGEMDTPLHKANKTIGSLRELSECLG